MEGPIIRAFGILGLTFAALALGAAAQAETPAPAPATAPPGPEQWGIVTNLPGGLCGAKAPAENGVELSLALSQDNTVSLLLSGADWKIQPQTYEIIMHLDDLAPFAFSMHGEGPALIGTVPPELRAVLLTAGKIGFHFNGKDYSVVVRNLAGVIDRLDTCLDARRAAARKR